jgi:drug/metabolite transporter (DMT)-like permease
MPQKHLIEHLKLHLVVFIYGFTAIFGKLIDLSAVHLVWYRVLIAGLSLYIFFKFNRTKTNLPLREVLKILGVGLIVGVHWITFFGAVKLSNVSVTLVCLSSTTLFTSLLEPLFYKVKLNIVEVIISIVIIIGLYLIFRFESQYWQGIVVALISSFLAGLFTVINRKLVSTHRARVISFYEMLGAFIGITIFLIISGEFTFQKFSLSTSDFVYLLILGIVCTAFAFVVQVDVMKNLSAYIVSLTINLEPVYGIILAYFIFGDNELMSTGFYIGTLIILLSVFGYPVYNHYKNFRNLK